MRPDLAACKTFWQSYLRTLPPSHPHGSKEPDAFAFGGSVSAALADELAFLVLSGKKRATASLAVEFTSLDEPLPVHGDLSIIVNGTGEPVAIIERTEVLTIPFGGVPATFAAVEGEGDGSLAYWRWAHTRYFTEVCSRLGGVFDEKTPVICQTFRLAWPAAVATDPVRMEIRVDDLRGPEIADLLREHLRNMRLHSPPESIHALNLEALRQPEITFWCVWQNEELMGCGAIKELDPRHGEIKSMRTVSAHLRRGVASALLRHIFEEAERRSYRRLSLETGSAAAFAPARKLYARFGFKACGPFADYVEDPYSVFMTREL